MEYGFFISIFLLGNLFHSEHTEAEAGRPKPVECFVPLLHHQIRDGVEAVDTDDQELRVEREFLHRLLKHEHFRTQGRKLAVLDPVVDDYEAHTTGEAESFEVLGGILESWHRQEVGAARPHEVEVVEVTGDLQIRPGVAIHILGATLLLVALRVRIRAEWVDEFHRNLLR